MGTRTKPDWRGTAKYRETVPTGMGGAIYIACLVAHEFGNRVPTVETLQHRFGMSRATAYRWRRAWGEVTAMAAARQGVATARRNGGAS